MSTSTFSLFTAEKGTSRQIPWDVFREQIKTTDQITNV